MTANWITGTLGRPLPVLVFALALAALLYMLWRTVRQQREDLERRRVAEETLRASMAEAEARARELAAQLEAAQRAAQRLSSSLDPDDVVEPFLGSVAERLGAEVAALYALEEGEAVGRYRMVFGEAGGVGARLAQEDIRQVRAPANLLPTLAQATATGEPHVVENAAREAGFGRQPPAGRDAARAWVTIPLLVGGQMVGAATWEVYTGPRRFAPEAIAFAQSLAVPVAAALRTAELTASLESARVEAAREASHLEAVLDQLADGVIVTDARGRVERSNRAVEELLGPEVGWLALEEWPERLGMMTDDRQPYGAVDLPLSRALAGERVQRAQFVVRTEGGTERHLSASAVPVTGPDGDVAGAAMVLRDMTDEHQYAEMLRHTNRELRQQAELLEEVNRQLRQATKAKDQFLAVMSHELRTPINAILGYADLLELEIRGTLSPEQKMMVSRIRQTSRHLLGLINEVLDLSKIGTGRMDLVLAEVDIGEVVEDAVQQVLPLATVKGLTLTVERLDRGKRPCLALADGARVAQVVINLVTNAAKFTAAGGVRVGYGRVGGRVHVTVKDTGPGIPPEHRERIFEEFYQVEGGLSRSSGGTGLGLAIARRFARLMGGDIRVTSEVGQGTEFIVDLPGAGTGVVERGCGQTGVLVLGCDDAGLRALLGGMDGSIRVAGATDPTRLAALARRERPRVVALDTSAPDFGAWRALQALQSDPQTRSIPVLLLARENERSELAMDFGAFTVVTKPLALEAVTEQVRRAGAEPGARVLVADDDPDVRRILEEALAAAGWSVEVAASGGETIRALGVTPPRVALLDAFMPNFNALAVLARMRANPSLSAVPTILLVGREFSFAELAELQASIRAVAAAGYARLLPVTDLLREACSPVPALVAVEDAELEEA